MHLKAKKPASFVLKQARIRIEGQQFWKVLGCLIGPTIISSFKLAFHPLYLCPDYMNANTFKSGSVDVQTSISFGLKYAHASIVKRMWWIVEHVSLRRLFFSFFSKTKQ